MSAVQPDIRQLNWSSQNTELIYLPEYARKRRLTIDQKPETTSTAARSSIPDMQSAAFKQLTEIAALEDGWDGEDADHPTTYAIARSFYLTDLIRIGTGGIEPIASMPLPDGGLQLEWQLSRGPRRYEIEVAPDGAISIMLVDLQSPEYHADVIGITPLRKAAELIVDGLLNA